MEEFSAVEVASHARVSRRQLIHWVEMRAIIPWKEDRRRGGRRFFNKQNLIEAMICRELNSYRVSVHLFKDILSGLRLVRFWRNLPEQYEFPLLVYPAPSFENEEVMGIGTSTADRIGEVLSRYPSAIVINLARLVEEAGGF